MAQLSGRMREHLAEGVTFVKWLLYSCLVGIIVGLVAVAFHVGIDMVTELREHHPRIIWLLPLVGPAIVLLYRWCGMERTGAPTWCWWRCGTRSGSSCAPRR